MRREYQTTEAKATMLRAIARKLPGNDFNVQRQKILRALKSLGSISTIEARSHLDVMHPAMRVFELKESGIKIDKEMVRQPDHEGRFHNNALYQMV